MAKMNTIRHLAVGEADLENRGDVARIERNLFADEKGETFEAIRFCKNRRGRHNRIHLVISEDGFVKLFDDAVEKGVFHEETLQELRRILGSPGFTRGEWSKKRDPFLDVVGICAGDGKLTENLDEELYGEASD